MDFYHIMQKKFFQKYFAAYIFKMFAYKTNLAKIIRSECQMMGFKKSPETVNLALLSEKSLKNPLKMYLQVKILLKIVLLYFLNKYIHQEMTKIEHSEHYGLGLPRTIGYNTPLVGP